ncbi:DUF362 domain-containing protein [Candidatus Woesearchaeota archaeon]|nr:DUF362 domain-containing protein [Candidatus Woesearchaeota archaeon]
MVKKSKSTAVDVAVMKCKRYDSSVFEAVTKALDMIGAKSILKPGMKVLIKPNMLSDAGPSRPVNTHPLVIDAVCRYLKDTNIGMEIYVGESSGAVSTNITAKAFKGSGIADVVRKHDIEFINFDEDEHTVTEIKDSIIMKKIGISKKLLEMDLVIDVCKLKTHMLTGYTGAVKNMFGILPGRAKTNAHHKGNTTAKFCNLLLDVYSAKIPKLCLMDGIIGMEGNGPTHGKAKKTGIIIASRDAVALDMVATRIIGFRFKDLDFLKTARKRRMAPERIRVLGIKNIKVPYKKPLSYKLNISQPVQNILYRTIKTYFNVNKPNCRACRQCMHLCPQNAISMRKGFPAFDKEKCIMCYCCHELCPHGAIVLKKPLVLRMGERLFKSLRD